MRNPSKKDSGKVVSIVGATGTLDESTTITGVYLHYYQKQTFGFRKLGEEHVGVFCRDEWEVMHVWKYPARWYEQQDDCVEVIEGMMSR